MKDGSWLERLKDSFALTGFDYEDLYGLIEASMIREKINFPAFISEALKGIGFSVGEGYFYSLDQDWDDPENFDEVTFFLGELETSSLSVGNYVLLMKTAADVYSVFFPEEKIRVFDSVKKLEERYIRFLDK